jgi:hypothetical protein
VVSSQVTGTGFTGYTSTSTYEDFHRSSAFFCEQCVGRQEKVFAAIQQMMALDGLFLPTKKRPTLRENPEGLVPAWYWRSLPDELVVQWLNRTSYVSVGAVMADDLARVHDASDATLVFHSERPQPYVVERNPSHVPVWIAIDDVTEGWGSLTEGFTGQVHVPAGVHKFLFGATGHATYLTHDEVIALAPLAKYEVDIARGFAGKGIRLRPALYVEVKRVT